MWHIVPCITKAATERLYSGKQTGKHRNLTKYSAVYTEDATLMNFHACKRISPSQKIVSKSYIKENPVAMASFLTMFFLVTMIK